MAVAYCEKCSKKVALKTSGACSLCGHQIIESDRGTYSIAQLFGVAFLVVMFGLGAKIMIDDQEDKRLTEQRQKEQVALQEKRAEEAVERAEREARIAERKAEREAKEAACNRSIQCLADKKSSFAEIYCPEHIERYAKHDFEWLDKGLLKTKFSQYRVKDEAKGVVTYVGDQIKFQNGFGAWSNIIYTCDVSVRNEQVLSVSVTEGRL